MTKDTNSTPCPACDGDGRPFAKDGSRNGNAQCPQCFGTGDVSTPPLPADDRASDRSGGVGGNE